jgi:lactate dehydrogenase-like 2-hydroxyacid dehydrogenase
MRVLYCNRSRVAEEVERRLAATWTTLDELLRQSDFVVLQVPYTPETHHLVGARELARMKSTAILINSTRGGVVDDAALVEALKAGTIRAAGLDVFENEPRLHPGFLELDNVVLAPHVGSSTEATRRAMAMTAAKNAVAALTGAIPPNLLNPEARRANVQG